jgi:NADH:ubiquinone oxidoreductase subunit H
MLLMFFLAEYLHLIISALHFILFFLGGWLSMDYLIVLNPLFLSFHDSNIYINTLL